MSEPEIGGLVSWNEVNWFLITSFKKSRDDVTWEVKGLELGVALTETVIFFGKKLRFYHNAQYKAPPASS